MDTSALLDLYPTLLELEQEGLATRTFRRLDPTRQQRVIQAILEEACEAGPGELNIKKVAARSGAAVGSLYQYFGSRDGLVNFASQLVTRAMVRSLAQVPAYLEGLPLDQALKAYLAGGLEYSQAMGGYIRYFAAAAYRGDPALADSLVRPLAEIMLQVVRQMLAAAQERGELRPGLDLEGAARLLNTLLIALGDAQLVPHLNNYYLLYDEAHGFESILDQAVALILAGWGAK